MLKTSNSEKPFFSIIVPTFNRPDRLAACLQSFAQIDYRRDRFEIIVVDDGGDVPLTSVVAAFQAQLSVTLLRQPHAGPAAARNTGTTQAKGEFLVFTDDDCLATSDWLEKLAARFTETRDRIIGGTTLNALSSNFYSTASQLLIDYLYSYYNFNPNEARFFASNNFALSKTLFEAIGGFNITFPLAAGEDREFCYRWLDRGYGMTYAPEVVVYHAHELTLFKFWRQQFNYGRGAFYLRQVCSQLNSTPSKLESPQFYLNLLVYPLQQKIPFSLPLTVLFVVSQVATAAGILWEKLSKGHKNFDRSFVEGEA
ncbi:MAG: glycosyltransferase [Microcoleus sp. SIO2G3]|nr:glycosyltransferase [Microcoleus sp. SIO2G3]